MRDARDLFQAFDPRGPAARAPRAQQRGKDGPGDRQRQPQPEPRARGQGGYHGEHQAIPRRRVSIRAQTMYATPKAAIPNTSHGPKRCSVSIHGDTA